MRVKGGEVIYVEMKLQRETDGTGEQTAISTREHPGHPNCSCLTLDTESDDFGNQLFVSKNGKLSEFNLFSDDNSSRTIDELDGDATKVSVVSKRRCFASDARSADGASLGCQTTYICWLAWVWA